jgi:hypothetical protein
MIKLLILSLLTIPGFSADPKLTELEKAKVQISGLQAKITDLEQTILQLQAQLVGNERSQVHGSQTKLQTDICAAHKLPADCVVGAEAVSTKPKDPKSK